MTENEKKMCEFNSAFIIKQTPANVYEIIYIVLGS